MTPPNVPPAPTRELCELCREFSPIGFHSPRVVWRAVAGRYEHDILCVSCFAMLGDEKGIAWEEGITLYPVSLATHREMRDESLMNHSTTSPALFCPNCRHARSMHKPVADEDRARCTICKCDTGLSPRDELEATLRWLWDRVPAQDRDEAHVRLRHLRRALGLDEAERGPYRVWVSAE